MSSMFLFPTRLPAFLGSLQALIGAEACEMLLEVTVVLVVFGVSTPFLARMRRRQTGTGSCGEHTSRTKGGSIFDSATCLSAADGNGLSKRQLYKQMRGRVSDGASVKALQQQAVAAYRPGSLADADRSWRGRGLCVPVEQKLPVLDPSCSGQGSRIPQFIAVNQLEGECLRRMQELPPQMMEWVMDQEFIVRDGNPSLAVERTIARSQELPEEFWDRFPTTSDVQKRLSTFVALNRLDVRCAKTLERLPEEGLRKVMDFEFLVQVDPTRGSASAKVVGNVMRVCRH